MNKKSKQIIFLQDATKIYNTLLENCHWSHLNGGIYHCILSQKEIQYKTQYSIPRIKKILQWLEKQGLIEIYFTGVAYTYTIKDKIA